MSSRMIIVDFRGILRAERAREKQSLIFSDRIPSLPMLLCGGVHLRRLSAFTAVMPSLLAMMSANISDWLKPLFHFLAKYIGTGTIKTLFVSGMDRLNPEISRCSIIISAIGNPAFQMPEYFIVLTRFCTEGSL